MSKSKGLGDSIEKVTKATGLKSLMELSMGAIGVKNCGCNKRKDWFNSKFPYKKY
jgi:hypothetical protein|tara:strand:- start:1194 stop:1358 length:165 start_codon:yes stop_codon:yes gene_type:complete